MAVRHPVILQRPCRWQICYCAGFGGLYTANLQGNSGSERQLSAHICRVKKADVT